MKFTQQEIEYLNGVSPVLFKLQKSNELQNKRRFRNCKY